MIGWMEPCSSFQSTWDFFFKKILSIPCLLKLMKILPRPKLDFHDKTLVCSLTLLWVLSNSLTIVRDLSYSHDQDHVHVHSQIASISIHLQNKTPSTIMTLSLRLPSRIWAIQKEIKDAYPKKVCHVPKRHDNEKKEREKMHTQRRYATCPQDI